MPFVSLVQVSQMVAKEFYLGQSLEAGNEESTLPQDPYEEELEEEEEALSLCDLPLYNNSSVSAQRFGGDNFSKEDGKNSISNNNKEEGDDDDDDFFEFFSEEFTTSTTHSTTTADNIIFCGKLIPFKDPPKKGNNPQSNVQKGTLLPWRSNSRPTSKAVKTCSDGSFKKGQEAKGAKSTNFTTCEYSSIGKVSLIRSTTKSRWFLFMFGMSRLSNSTAVELSDIRSRQSQSRRAMFAAPPENGEEMRIKERTNCKGLWRVLRSISVGLGCRSSKLANDVVKAAFV